MKCGMEPYLWLPTSIRTYENARASFSYLNSYWNSQGQLTSKVLSIQLVNTLVEVRDNVGKVCTIPKGKYSTRSTVET
jgi:hypothetical protein